MRSLLVALSLVASTCFASPAIFYGKVTPEIKADIIAPFDGNLEIECSAPCAVHENQVIGKISAHVAQERALQLATQEQQLSDEYSQLSDWPNSYEMGLAQHQYVNAKLTTKYACDRQLQSDRLFDKGLISLEEKNGDEKQCILAKQQFELAEKNLRRTDEKGSRARGEQVSERLEQVTTQLKITQEKLKQLVLIAPVEGLLYPLIDQNGNHWRNHRAIVSNEVLAHVVDAERLQIVVLVDEYDLPFLEKATQITAKLNALEGVTLAGHLKCIAPIAQHDSQQVAQYQVRFSFDTAPLESLPWRWGMTALVQVSA